MEASRIAVKQAQLNARLNDAINVEFFEGPVDDALRHSPDLRPDVIVINPPRAGAGREVTALAAGLGAEHILYVSCNPSIARRCQPFWRRDIPSPVSLW